MEIAFAGIDVACAKRKPLPIVVCTRQSGRLIPLPLRSRDLPSPPRGMGNALAIDREVVARFADESARYLHDVERELGIGVVRIAIDAPSDPKHPQIDRRAAECAMDQRRISCFATPDVTTFDRIIDKVRGHLSSGGQHSRIPHANQLWMLVGFALFERLRRDWECIEVFPQAIARTLDRSRVHKAQSGGVSLQLAAAARHTGWPIPPEPEALRTAGFGKVHDVLDAYLSAWVASLEPHDREALGSPPDDVIWIPKVSAG